ncbi:MAG: hypothetical protein AB1324_00935 [Candidatus Micrarchaeota archaeon]
MEDEERLCRLDKLISRMKGRWILVEGLRDKKALRALGMSNVLTMSGNLRLSCGVLEREGAQKAYVLSDLDRRGDELAKLARGELESRSIRADTEARRELAHLLRIRFFEDAEKAYAKLKEEVENKKK